MAIGIVLAKPDKNRVQPSTLRRSPLNLVASSNPAPNPIAPRVAAIHAISGTVTLLASEIFITASPSDDRLLLLTGAPGFRLWLFLALTADLESTARLFGFLWSRH